MLTTTDVVELSAKFNQVLAKRSKPQDTAALPFQNLSVIRNISRTKFPVYLTFCKSTQKHYAMKVFPFLGGELHPCFTNESRFSGLKHPNIINFVHSKAEKHILQKGELKKVSYILTEYAPYGDFFEFIVKHREEIDDKLARTYFRQLIDGIDYLHKCSIAHLDLKPENLLIGADFSLKIIDFDLSYFQGDTRILTTGTKYCRAPELKARHESANPFAADIYCAGIILFILKSGGYAHLENEIVDGINFFELMNKNNPKFWSKHCKIEGREKSFYDSSFKELFNNMVKLNPKKRICIRQIQKSKWYNGSVYTPKELDERMKHILTCSTTANHELP